MAWLAHSPDLANRALICCWPLAAWSFLISELVGTHDHISVPSMTIYVVLNGACSQTRGEVQLLPSPDMNLVPFVLKHCKSFMRGTPRILESTGIPYALCRKLHSGWWKPFQVLSLQ